MTRRLGALVALVAAAATPARADPETLLPKGVGIVQLSERQYRDVSGTFDSGGGRSSLSDRYARDLTGQSLKAGDGGAALQKLAAQIDRMDPKQGTSQSLLNDMNLGHVGMDVKASVNVAILGAGYGVTDLWSLFIGVPLIRASVDADLAYQATNNAADIKSRLGGYAYPTLRAGLDQASAINVQQIRAAFDAYGYQPLGHWQKQGFGDVQAGARTAWVHRLGTNTAGSVALIPSLTLPTGSVKDPDVLQSLDLGTGYDSLGVAAEPAVAYRHWAHVGLPVSYAHNFETQASRRVPEAGQTLADRSRTASVRQRPGDNTEFGLDLGAAYGPVGAEVQHGMKRHFGDRYAGGLAGDYGALSAGSDTTQVYRLSTVKFDSTAAYQKGRFAVPVIISLSAFETLAGRNCIDERYYQLTVASFFRGGSR